MLAILFTFTQCGVIGGGGSGGSALVPVVGMYFLHPDHLGSITMITDGRGNVIAGGNNGGKSHISYTPYGSIHRTDSSGPDITKFKFTGQEEDKESGLMYYKARYYDPAIGRFLQADNEYNSEDTHGMNHYMYVNGSPMNFRDDTGNSCSRNYSSALFGLARGPVGFAIGGVAPGHNFTGNGRCGGKPNKLAALELLFFKETGNGSDLSKVYLISLYYETQKARGMPVFLDGLNTDRRTYAGMLIGLVYEHQIEGWQAGLVYFAMTHNVRQPTNGIDRASYNHDFSDGSTPPRHKAKESNNRWVRNAWANIHNPWDLSMAITGTILFKASNLIGDASSISKDKRTSHSSCVQCPSVKFHGSYLKSFSKWKL